MSLLKLGVLGYVPLGKWNIDLGPLLYSYANNTIEGNRFRLGMRTNAGFSKKWLLSGYLAYGTKDKELKYSVGIDYILSRKPWTVVGARQSYDLERIGVSSDNIGEILSFPLTPGSAPSVGLIFRKSSRYIFSGKWGMVLRRH